jgi:hypothetical protein
VSTRKDDVLVGVFNFADTPQQRVVDLASLGVLEGGDLDGELELEEMLLGGAVTLRDGALDLGVLAAHDARVLRIPKLRS